MEDELPPEEDVDGEVRVPEEAFFPAGVLLAPDEPGPDEPGPDEPGPDEPAPAASLPVGEDAPDEAPDDPPGPERESVR